MELPMQFPKGFLFGAATAAHQVEGGNRNSDWWLWEQETAHRRAQDARRKEWPEHLLQMWPSPLEEENYLSGVACDHYNRFREDFVLAKELGHNAHRFSIEWARIEPEEGVFDEKEIAHYREVFRALRENGLTPFVTLHHFTNPLWFAAKGGWLNPKAPEYFARYARRMIEEYACDAEFWATINEPEVVTSIGYFLGRWPPEKKSRLLARTALSRMAEAHQKAYAEMREAARKSGRNIQIGIVYNATAWLPRTNTPWNHALAALRSYVSTYRFLDRIRDSFDFLGVNYYFAVRVGLSFGAWCTSCGSGEKSDYGWDIYPDGLRKVTEELWKRYRKPIYITETGVADVRGVLGPKFIDYHLDAIYRAIRKGADVRGCFYWSLLDNSEWADGFTQRFGLVAVDFETQSRTPRKSAYVYRDIIRQL